MHQAKFLVGKGLYLYGPHLEVDSAERTLCYLERARSLLATAKGKCGSRRFEFEEVPRTGPRREIRTDADVAQATVDAIVRGKINVGTPAKYLAFVDERLAETRTSKQMATALAEGRRLVRSYGKNKDLGTFQAGLERVATRVETLRMKPECQRLGKCPGAAKRELDGLTRALYEAGGAVSTGPSRAEYDAKVAAGKAAQRKRKEFENKQERMQVLMAAAFGARVGLAKTWLEKGLDPDITYPDFEGGKTALMIFAKSGSRKGVELLLSHGASRTKKDSAGKTAADICRAASKCGADILALLTGKASPSGPSPNPGKGSSAKRPLPPGAEKYVAKLKQGDLQAGVTFVMMASLDELAPHVSPDAAPLRAWKSKVQKMKGLTSRQVYGSLLANWAARAPGLSTAERRKRLAEAFEDLTSAPFEFGILAVEAAELAEFLGKPKADVARYRDQAASKLLSTGLARQGPPPIWLGSLALAGSLLRHPHFEAARKRGEGIPIRGPKGQRASFDKTPEQIAQVVKKSFPPNAPAGLRDEMMATARAYRPRLGLAGGGR
jgi:hypothetical protein